MMTRTSGADYATDRIWMNSVDTGWVTDENPQNWRSEDNVPLDEIDGAARVMDLVSHTIFFLKIFNKIFIGVNTGKHVHSQFYKDYQSVLW